LCEKPLSSNLAGTIFSKNEHLYIKCVDNWLEILELQLAGKKRMAAKDFLLGFKVDAYRCI